MRIRLAWIAFVAMACRNTDAPPVASAPRTEEPPAATAPASPTTESTAPPATSSAPAASAPADPKASRDQPTAVSTAEQFAELERVVAPYRELARSTYPSAKRRFLAGLPAGDRFSVTTKLQSPRAAEVVFVSVASITNGQITGHIASDIRSVVGYKLGDPYTLAEADVMDWVILHPDGVEEGNVIGKFLDTYDGRPH